MNPGGKLPLSIPRSVEDLVPFDNRAKKVECDFAKGKRGPVIKTPPGKTRITIRIDDDILAWFRERVHDAGGATRPC